MPGVLATEGNYCGTSHTEGGRGPATLRHGLRLSYNKSREVPV